MRRLWLVLLAAIAGALRSWVGFWYRLAQAVERRLQASQGPDEAWDGVEGLPVVRHRPPADWLARVRRDQPPAHWLAYVQSRAPDLSFPRYYAPAGPLPSPRAEDEPLTSGGGFPAPDGSLSRSAGEPRVFGHPLTEMPPASAGERPPTRRSPETGHEPARDALSTRHSTAEAPSRRRQYLWSPLKWVRSVVKPRMAARRVLKLAGQTGPQETPPEPGRPGQASPPGGRPREHAPEHISPVPRAVKTAPSRPSADVDRWPALPGDAGPREKDGAAAQPSAPLGPPVHGAAGAVPGERAPDAASSPQARKRPDRIPQRTEATVRPDPLADLTVHRWPDLPEERDWTADPGHGIESVENEMRAWRRRRRLDDEQKGRLWNESLY